MTDNASIVLGCFICDICFVLQWLDDGPRLYESGGSVVLQCAVV